MVVSARLSVLQIAETIKALTTKNIYKKILKVCVESKILLNLNKM